MRVVAVFSGGGVKALAHLGAYRALGEKGLEPTHYVATSFGSVIAAAIAAGATYETLVSGVVAMRGRDVAPPERLALFKGVFADHLIQPEPLRDTIARLVPARRWEELRVPVTVTMTDVDSGALVLCGARGGHPHARSDIPLLDALYASCALPLYYAPLAYDGHRYAEGGLRAVLPLGAARELPADLVVAVNVGPGFDETSPPGGSGKLPALVRAYDDATRVLMAGQIEQAIAAWPVDGPRLVLVRPVHEKGATFAVEHASRYLDAGYEMTKAAL